MYRLFLKRVFDLVIATILILALIPLLIIAVLLLTLVNQGNPFFIQARPGKNEKIFYIIKLKTMNDKVDSIGNLLPDNVRLTKVGSIVRKLSLDELPQLFNVIKGEMSLIGPRPLLPQYLPLYNASQKKRHNIRPGITGWAQVNGRNLLTWKQKFNYDVWYVDNLSFKIDIKIFILTLLKIFKREGVNSNNSATMEPFNGLN